MTYKNQTPVMDVLPWPQGHGFAGTSDWWEYMLGKDEDRRLDNLMGIALLDEGVSQRLLNDRDDTLLASFGLSKETRLWLRGIQAGSLVELAQAIVSAPRHGSPTLTEAS
jgi:hypothetical protein